MTEVAVQTDGTLPGMDDLDAVHREITTILVEHDQADLLEVSDVEERALELTRARHAREAEEARSSADVNVRLLEYQSDEEGAMRGHPRPRLVDVADEEE